MGAVAGFEVVYITVGGLDAEVIGEGHYAAAAVAAHHAARSVGIEESHLEIETLRGQKHHQTVGFEVVADILDVPFPWRGPASVAATASAVVSAAVVLTFISLVVVAVVLTFISLVVVAAAVFVVATALAVFAAFAFALCGIIHFTYNFTSVENDEGVSCS